MGTGERKLLQKKQVVAVRRLMTLNADNPPSNGAGGIRTPVRARATTRPPKTCATCRRRAVQNPVQFRGRGCPKTLFDRCRLLANAVRLGRNSFSQARLRALAQLKASCEDWCVTINQRRRLKDERQYHAEPAWPATNER